MKATGTPRKSSRCSSAGAGGARNGLKPETPGVGVSWLDDDGHWQMYSEAQTEAIISAYSVGDKEVHLGCIPGSSSARGSNRKLDRKLKRITGREVVNLETLVQRNDVTKVEREIQIQIPALTKLNYMPTYDPIECGVWWKGDDGRWREYESPQLEWKILSTWRSNQTHVPLGLIVSPKWPRGALYSFNPRTTKQINVQTGREREIRIIPYMPMPVDTQLGPPWNGVECKKLNRKSVSVSSALVEAAFRKLVSRTYTEIIISKKLKPFKLLRVESNKHLKGAGQRMYKQFLSIFEKVATKTPGGCGQLLKIMQFSREFGVEEIPLSTWKPLVRHVFFGTASSNLELIMRSGIRKRSICSTDGLGIACVDSEPFCDSAGDNPQEFQMLVLLVYNIKTSRKPDSNCLVVSHCPDPKYLLPIAKITLART